MSKYAHIECTHYDENEEKYCVDAWLTNDDNEEGSVIAKIDLSNNKIDYIDKDAITDEYAQSVIHEMLENGYVLTE